jgi:hypothetical protein
VFVGQLVEFRLLEGHFALPAIEQFVLGLAATWVISDSNVWRICCASSESSCCGVITERVTSQTAVEHVLSAQRVLRQLESRDRYSLSGGSLRTSTPWPREDIDILEGVSITFARQ